MKIAVALLTCDRYDYTAKTVDSFLEHNNADDFLLFHADDASTDPRVVEYVQSRGFATVVRNDKRQGCSPTTRLLFAQVAKQVPASTLLLYLQNDFETLRTLPIPLVRELLSDNDNAFVQLSYRRPGKHRMRSQKWYWPDGRLWVYPESSRGDYIVTRPGGLQAYHPAVAPVETWVRCARRVKNEPAFIRHSRRLKKRMVRLTPKIMSTIGKNTTPNGRFGRRHKDRRGAREGRRLALDAYSTAHPKRSRYYAGPRLCSYLGEVLHPGMRTLETGSGLTTWLFYAIGCDHTALEDLPEFAPPLPCVQVRPLVDGWYDWKPEEPYDLVLIDGPRRRREGVLQRIDQLVHPASTVVVDDTQRPRDMNLARAIAKQIGFDRHNYIDGPKQFSVLTPRIV